MKAIIAAGLILAAPGLASAESWVLWETKAFRDRDPVRWRTVKVYPSEDAA